MLALEGTWRVMGSEDQRKILAVKVLTGPFFI